VIIFLRWMCIETTSLLRDSYHHSSKLFHLCNFTISTYYIYSIEVIVHWLSFVVLCISLLWYSIYYSFCSTHKSDHWYQSGMLFICFSLCMSLTRSQYKKFGVEPVKPLQHQLCRTRTKIMEDNKKYDGVGYPFKMLLEESLVQKGTR
jgi:hypothetical protein